MELTLDVDTSASSSTESYRDSCSAAALDQRSQVDTYMYSVLTLPDEIVSEIFLQYTPPYPLHPPLRGEGSPTHLTQICRRWRSIAHNTPQLWQAIRLYDTEESYGQDILVAESWLQRSCSLPLSIILLEGVFSCSFRENAQARARGAALPLLLKHKARWEYVMLNYASSARGAGAIYPLGSLPALRSIRFVQGRHGEDLFNIAESPWDAPNLRRAAFNCNWQANEHIPKSLTARVISRSLSAVLPQLTHLYLDHISESINHIPQILQQTLSLVHCWLDFETPERNFSWTSDVIHLDHLQSLALLGSTSADGALPFLHQLRTPQLRYLLVHEPMFKFRRRSNTDSESESLGEVVDSLGAVESLRALHILRARFPKAYYQEKFPRISSIVLDSYPFLSPSAVGGWEFWSRRQWVL
ncbi:F-box domain-containing protein [Mycena chlorophos]|uniref:F-box domain-containing protein n=1 Tax=Mycena chlorophos TaxID=658473 RepID=A0A8H6TT25_MYCCL|nr:F-box domain-containing protein [Mycena chlorophos]